MRKQLTRAILVTGTVAAALSLGVGPAFAVTTWNVSGGKNWTSKQAANTTFVLTDTTHNDGFKCKTATGMGTVINETHGTITAIGSVTGSTFGDPNNLCTSFNIIGGPTGTSTQTTNTTATLNVSSYNSMTGVTTGTISNVNETLTASAFFASCTVVVTGTAGVTYTNSSDLLQFTTAGDSLSVASTSGTCPGVSKGDTVTFSSGTGGEVVTGSPTNPIQISSP